MDKGNDTFYYVDKYIFQNFTEENHTRFSIYCHRYEV